QGYHQVRLHFPSPGHLHVDPEIPAFAGLAPAYADRGIERKPARSLHAGRGRKQAPCLAVRPQQRGPPQAASVPSGCHDPGPYGADHGRSAGAGSSAHARGCSGAGRCAGYGIGQIMEANMRRTYHPSPMNITPEAINRISVGARLAGMWPYLEEEIENMQKDVTARAMRAMQKGELTPEKALAYWQE